jgi:hypothetical protein
LLLIFSYFYICIFSYSHVLRYSHIHIFIYWILFDVSYFKCVILIHIFQIIIGIVIESREIFINPVEWSMKSINLAGFYSNSINHRLFHWWSCIWNIITSVRYHLFNSNDMKCWTIDQWN